MYIMCISNLISIDLSFNLESNNRYGLTSVKHRLPLIYLACVYVIFSSIR